MYFKIFVFVSLFVISNDVQSQKGEKDVLSDYFEKVGGKKKLKTVNSYKIEYLSLSGVKRNIVYQKKDSGIIKLRTEQFSRESNNPNVTVLCNEKEAYAFWHDQVRYDHGPEQIKDDYILNQRYCGFIELHVLLFEAYEDNRLKLLGSKEFNKHECYEFEYKSGHTLNYPTSIFIDKQTSLLVGITEYTPRGDNITKIGSYQIVSGFLVPHKYELSKLGKSETTMELINVIINPDIDDKLFCDHLFL